MPIRDNSPVQYLLRPDHALLHEEGACLPMRSRHGQCRSCETACPVAAIQVSLDAVLLTPACTGCGRCVAACPTEALMLPELQQVYGSVALALGEAPAGSTIRLECRKVPAAARRQGSVVMPCLGAVRVGQLLAYRAAGHAVELVDRGWCQGCESGCGESHADHPAREAIESARLWLNALDAGTLPELVHEPLPLAQRPDAMPEAPSAPTPLDRRSFFRAALERPAGRVGAGATPMGADGRAAYPADRRQPSPERQRQLASLLTLAASTRHPLPAEFFPVLHVNADCCDRRLCVALCPTAALTALEREGEARLQITSERCIACGACERGCPQGAITMQPFGGQPGVHTLRVHARATCLSCGDAYTPADAQGQDDEAPGLCPTCIKSRRFMSDAQRQLFGKLN